MRKATSIILIIIMLICITSCGGSTRIFPISYGEAKGLVKYILKGDGVFTKCESVHITKNADGSLDEVHIELSNVHTGVEGVFELANEYANLHPEDELFNGKTKVSISFTNIGQPTYAEIYNYERRVIDGEEFIEIKPYMFNLNTCEPLSELFPGVEVLRMNEYCKVEVEFFQNVTDLRRVYLSSDQNLYTEEERLEFEVAYPDIEFILV